ncbi:MAG TPA: hypothetical protein VMM81_03130 [Acidimicrobiia bacterium]|nr:hypothetical protein [Acidimicrobiia bacterium]
MRTRALLLAVAAVLLAGCQAAPVEEIPTPDPAAIPSGSPQAHGATATGPIVELGSGVMSGLGWRYLAYPSDAGWCTQLETAAAIETDCGGLVPDEGSGFGSVSENGRVIHGIATPDAATVWLLVDNTPTVPAFLMPLSEAGLEGGVAFVGIVPTGTEVTHVMAVKFNGEVLGTRELP